MADKNKVYTFKMDDLVWAKMLSYCYWPGRIVEPNTPAIAKLRKSPSQHCVFFFGSNNYGWIDEKSLRPYAEFRDEFKAKGRPKDVFGQAMNDIESFIENPEGFSALFERKPTVQKKKASPKPKKQDIELDFDSLKSDSSVPSLNVSKSSTPASASKRSSSVRSSEKPKALEKTPKVPAIKRKATRESESEETIEQDVAPTPTKKPRKTSQTSAAVSLPKKEHVFEPSRRSAFVDAAKENPARTAVEASRSVFGFIGLGIMGRNILNNLLKTGHEVVIWNRTQDRCVEFINDSGAHCLIANSPKEVFEQAHITFVCLSDSEAVKETICDGERGVIAADILGLDKGLVMLSSIDVETSKDINSAIMIQGTVRYLEAQIQGSRKEAADGQLIIIAAGDESLFKDCNSCFKAMAKDTNFIGEEIGAAVKMNLVLQTIAGVQLAAVSEAFALADSFDLQLRDILEIIGISNLQSDFIMEKGDVIIKEQFRDPSMRINTMQKDLKMAIEFGDACEQPQHLVTTSNEIFKSAKRLGMGKDDIASVYLALNIKYPSEINGI